MNLVYRKKNFNVYQFDNEYIIHNTNKEFNEGHTHIRNFKTAKFLIDLSIHKSIPHHLHHYLLESLARIADDDKHAEYIRTLIDIKHNKDKDVFYNSKKRRRNKYNSKRA